MAVMRALGPDRPPACVVRERLTGEVDPILAARWLRDEPRAVALSGEWAGGGVVLSSHPAAVADPDDDPFAILDSLPVALEVPTGESESPAAAGADPVIVGGGWFGWLGFGLARAVERLPPAPPRPLNLPLFDLAFHDHVVRCEAGGEWWFEALWTEARADFLSHRLEIWRQRLAPDAPPAGAVAAGGLDAVGAGLRGHFAAVAETVRRITEGEFSQANICLRLQAAFAGDPLDLWIESAAATRAAYAAYIGPGPGASGQTVVSVSPELFLRRKGQQVVTRPIKGTAPLTEDPATLATSAKDRAENVMIVDLMRNDLGRVSSYGSVKVDELCAVRPAAGVWHLESTVSGRLRPGVRDADLLRATFPPGSVTGAPKVQALRTIHELEGTAREAYCGAIGLRSPLAGLELNVAIRTMEVSGNRLWLGVGGGVVGDSSPAAEVEEALAKARGVAAAAGLSVTAKPPQAPGAELPGPFTRCPLEAPGPAMTGPIAQRPRPGPALTGAIARAPRPDSALGVFETIRVRGGRPRWLDDHSARLRASCRALSLLPPPNLEDRVAEAAAELDDGGVRVLVSANELRISTRGLPALGPSALRPIVVPGGLGAHKWADRTLIDAYTEPGVTPLICDLDGSVLEAGYAAVLLAVDDALIAPPLDGRLLPSISRQYTLRAGREAGWRIVIQPFTLKDLPSASAIVLTSSLRGPHPGVLEDAAPSQRGTAVCAELVEALSTG